MSEQKRQLLNALRRAADDVSTARVLLEGSLRYLEATVYAALSAQNDDDDGLVNGRPTIQVQKTGSQPSEAWLP